MIKIVSQDFPNKKGSVISVIMKNMVSCILPQDIVNQILTIPKLNPQKKILHSKGLNNLKKKNNSTLKIRNKEKKKDLHRFAIVLNLI